MDLKLRKCDGCGSEVYGSKQYGSAKLCYQCWWVRVPEMPGQDSTACVAALEADALAMAQALDFVARDQRRCLMCGSANHVGDGHANWCKIGKHLRTTAAASDTATQSASDVLESVDPGETGITAGELDASGELVLFLEVDGRRGRVFISHEFWEAIGAVWNGVQQQNQTTAENTKRLCYPDIPPMAVEPFFSRHMEAMTVENLRDKSDIAIQLALRDKRLEKAVHSHKDELTALHEKRRALEALIKCMADEGENTYGFRQELVDRARAFLDGETGVATT